MISPWLFWGGSLFFFALMSAFVLPAQGYMHRINCSPRIAVILGLIFGFLGLIVFFLPFFIYK